MENANRCRGCGQERPADAPVGLCPLCLLRAGQTSDQEIDDLDAAETRVLLDPEVSSRLADLAGLASGHSDGSGTGGAHVEGGTPPRPARLELFGPIGRGGMGVVLKGRDGDLGRELAVKVLLGKFCDQPEMIRRFVEEAQIGGQLQHPGVVPVYELGRLPDHRPYFAMKLIKGRTLAELLGARANLDDDRPRLLGVFEAVCQTMAYAHSRAVIHRDLKPANIMVGSFGEVQVMDWGVAKVLARSGEPGGEADRESSLGGEHADPGHSRPGSVIGTPAYMAPEQARGELEAVDERADVFALGAILCEILTGSPVFMGSSSVEIEKLAARGDVAGALARLANSGADPELVDLASNSIAPGRDDRPRDAQIVAERMMAYRAGVEAKLRGAELAAVEARARADEEAKRRALADQLAREAVERASLERRRRRLAMALAASILTLVVGSGGIAAWIIQDRQSTLAKVDLALKESEVLHAQALGDETGDVSKWQAARLAIVRARELLEAAPSAATKQRLDELSERIERGAAAAEIDRKLVTRLEEIRAGLDGDTKANEAYAEAFRAAGLDLGAQGVDPVGVGKRLAARPKGIAQAAAGALDAWALVRRSLTSPGDAGGWADFQNLLAAARAADPDPWRESLHQALSTSDPAPLTRLADGSDLDRLGPTRLWFLGYGLEVLGDRERALKVLKRAQRAYPDDYWLNTELALVLMEVKRSGPGATSSFITASSGTSVAKYREAESYLMAAVAIRPRFAPAHHLLGTACQFQGRWDEAIACYQDGLRLAPDDATIYNSLANVYMNEGKQDEAVAAYREAIRLSPEYELAHANLMLLLGNIGRLDDAIKAARAAIASASGFHAAHMLLGDFLAAKGVMDEAIAEYQIAARLMPASSQVRDHFGSARLQQGKPDQAIALYREAIGLDRDFVLAHQHLAYVLLRHGDVDGAISEYREIVRIAPQYAYGYANLALALRQKGEFEEGAAAFRKALDMNIDPAGAATLRLELAKTERWQALASRVPAIVRGEDNGQGPAETLDLAYFLFERREFARAAELFESALAQDPKLADDGQSQNRYNASCALVVAAASAEKSVPPLVDAEKARLRDRALRHLTADLERWERVLKTGAGEAATLARQTLRHWRVDPDMWSVREPGALGGRSEAERRQWLALWEKVDGLLQPGKP
jgi:serine/threonine-protein kinase